MTTYKIHLTKLTNKGNVSRDISFITDFKMVTRHNDPSDTFKIWREKTARGEKVSWKRGILIEYFEDQTAEEIRDHVVKEMEIMKEKFKKEMEITWRIE